MMNDLFKKLTVKLGNDTQLSVQVADQLAWLIASGKIKDGEKLPSVRKLADYLGINLHTVRAAYKKIEEINLIQTRKGLGSVVLGYDIQAASRRATQSRTNTIGLIVPKIGGTFYQNMLRGVEELASKQNFMVMLCNTDESHVKGRAFLDMLIARQVDGVIVGPYGLRTNDYEPDDVKNPAKSAIPIVYADRPNETHYSILLDSMGAGKSVAQHLIQLNHQRMAIISSRVSSSSLEQCYLGFSNELKNQENPLRDPCSVEIKDHTFQSGYESVEYLLSLPEPPTAVFAVGDLVAIGVIRACRERGISVPGDLAVVSYNDSDVAAFTTPSLSTVYTAPFEMGVKSMEMLSELISGCVPKKKRHILPTRLVIRESCGGQTSKTS